LRFACAVLASTTLVAASCAFAADVDSGRRLAEARCVPCHQVRDSPARQVTQAPPFEAIARKFAVSPETLAFAILEPHPRMNVTISRREAEDIAAYVATLAR
jgi:mono/diheme cytochrome c family protein